MEERELTLQDYIIDKFTKENAQLKLALAEMEFRLMVAQQEPKENTET
ncbi:MAG: hypothetical protein Q4F05_11200 [bacterium]|nr:hypothetical protein [bacterium]